MEKKNLLFLAIGIIIPFALAFIIPVADSAIPPTPAFFSIVSNDTDATTNPGITQADNFNQKLMIVTDGSILVESITFDLNDKE